MNKSYLTAISRKSISAPLKELLKQNIITKAEKVLDYGCGKGKDWSWLKDNGYNASGFDPHWNPDDEAIKTTYDIILCTYVLNVVDKKERVTIIKNIKSLLNTDGKAYIIVRRDFEKDYTTQKGTKQFVVRLRNKIIKETKDFCIYEIRANDD